MRLSTLYNANLSRFVIYLNMFDFKNKVVIITGGGSGIGRKTAHILKSLGADLCLLGRTYEKLQLVKDELGGNTSIYKADIRNEIDVKASVDGILKQYGRIDCLVNNAGGQFPAPLKDISLNGWNAVIANNLTATFLMSKEVYIRWMENNGGSIVNVGSNWETGNPGMGHNGAARAGQANFTQTAAAEWASSNVRINQVVPGFINSSGISTYSAEHQKVFETVKSRIPLKRLGTEEEIANTIIFLLSDAASYITGVSIRIDGGLHTGVRSFFYNN